MLIIHTEIQSPDWDEIADELEDAFDEGMSAVSEEIEWETRRLASNTLEESLSTYLEGLSIETYGSEIQVNLEGELATAVEGGSDRFDLKPGYLGNALSRIIPLTGREPLRFRTAPYSSNSPPWYHPGIKPRRLIDKAIGKVFESDMDRIFDEKFRSRIKI